MVGVTKEELKSVHILMEFRSKYSEYDDLDNLTLAEKLANKYPKYDQVYKDFKRINESQFTRKSSPHYQSALLHYQMDWAGFWRN